MEFEELPVRSVPLGAPCVVRDCHAAGVVEAMHERERVVFCASHFSAYHRGELRAIAPVKG